MDNQMSRPAILRHRTLSETHQSQTSFDNTNTCALAQTRPYHETGAILLLPIFVHLPLR